VQVTDAAQASVEKTLAILVQPEPLAIQTEELPAAQLGTAYEATLVASGGTAPYAWSIESGTLPDGLALAPATGVISGTPTVDGRFTFTAQVTDSAAVTDSTLLSITVELAPLVIETEQLPSAQLGVAYDATLEASGGKEPYSWAIVQGGLPGGLTLDIATGAISGTATAEGTFDLTVQLVDATEQAVSKALSLTVLPAFAIVTDALPEGQIDVAYSASLEASGGTEPYAWSITAGALPIGVTLDSATGQIAGTPTEAGNFAVTFTVTDADSDTASRELPITIAAAPLVIETTSLPSAVLGTTYEATLAATGGTEPFTWTVTEGALPDGLVLAEGTGVISGTPTAEGEFAITVQVEDSAEVTASKALTITVTEEPTLWDILESTPELSTLKAAAEAAGLKETLEGDDALTVFAPNNDAFDALPEGALDDLLANPQALTAVLTYHALPGSLTAADLVAGDYETLLENAFLTIAVSDGVVTVNTATVITADVLASNGVAHIIDTVLSPPTPALEPPVIADGQITITWTGNGEVQTASAVEGPWVGTGNTSGSFSEAVSPTGNKYYRVGPAQ
jgi:uncharacterized surface protein with fasciclin (FAS1) repeats